MWRLWCGGGWQHKRWHGWGGLCGGEGYGVAEGSNIKDGMDQAFYGGGGYGTMKGSSYTRSFASFRIDVVGEYLH